MKIVFIANNNFTQNWILYLYISVFILFWVSEIYISGKTRKNSGGKVEKDRGSFYVIIACTWAIVIMNFYWTIEKNLLSMIFEYIGICLMIVGIVIRVYSVKLLDKAFTTRVCTGDKQEIIKKGIYKLVRHPAYLGSIMTMVGMSMALRNIFNFNITILLLVIMYSYRIRVEEKALIENFGDKYLEYKKETKCIIPKIL